MLYHDCNMSRRPRFRADADVDAGELARFQAGIRRRYSDTQILDELRRSAKRLERSPTMKEFAADPQARVHPQTVIEHFGTWNAAKRAAGLMPRRFATRVELLAQLRRLGQELGRVPTARDLDTHRTTMPSKSLYWHTFGSLTSALREAGFDVELGEERLGRALSEGAALSRLVVHIDRNRAGVVVDHIADFGGLYRELAIDLDFRQCRGQALGQSQKFLAPATAHTHLLDGTGGKK